MSMKRVGVLRGGPSPEYDVSLKTGGSVLLHLNRDKYSPVDVLLTKNGEWFMNGFQVSPEKASRNVDVFFNALHGEYGEDGKVQQILDSLGVPYTGSGVMPSALGMNKGLAKHAFDHSGIKTPRGYAIRRDEDSIERAFQIFKEFSAPYVIKPMNSGSSLDVVIAQKYTDLVEYLEALLLKYEVILVEEYIRGREMTCGVIDSLESADVYSMYPVEIVRPFGEHVWSYESKYGNQTKKVCPPNIDDDRLSLVQALAVQAHTALGLRHYSRSDFIVSPKGIYLLEVNSLPGLTPESLLPMSLSAAGFEFPDFLDYVVTLALNKK